MPERGVLDPAGLMQSGRDRACESRTARGRLLPVARRRAPAAAGRPGRQPRHRHDLERQCRAIHQRLLCPRPAVPVQEVRGHARLPELAARPAGDRRVREGYRAQASLPDQLRRGPRHPDPQQEAAHARRHQGPEDPFDQYAGGVRDLQGLGRQSDAGGLGPDLHRAAAGRGGRDAEQYRPGLVGQVRRGGEVQHPAQLHLVLRPGVHERQEVRVGQ